MGVTMVAVAAAGRESGTQPPGRGVAMITSVTRDGVQLSTCSLFFVYPRVGSLGEGVLLRSQLSPGGSARVFYSRLAFLLVKLVEMAEACGGRKTVCTPGLKVALGCPTMTNGGTVSQADTVLLKGLPWVGSVRVSVESVSTAVAMGMKMAVRLSRVY